MIKFRLQCSKRHQFEGWFKSGQDYDRQAKRKLVSCPTCGSTGVEKAVMSPSVVKRSRSRAAEPAATKPEAAPVGAGQGGEMVPVAMRQEMAQLMRKLRAEIERTSEYVGPRFAEEARKIHYQESESRGIYGEASSDDVRALHEEGVEIYPMPRLPEDHN